MPGNQIGEYTRRDLFDRLTLEGVDWSGRMAESAFLDRIFKISELPSRDSRVGTMLADVSLHRENFYDWGGPEWVYDDTRLNLAECPDEKFLEFLAFMVHPRVRPDEQDIDRILGIINAIIGRDGFELIAIEEVSGKRIFAGRPVVANHGGQTQEAAQIADEMASSHVARQVARMKDSLTTDPALAIGSAKEFLESIAKGILRDQGVTLTGTESMPQLVKLARDHLNLSITADADASLKRVLSGLSTVTQGIAELRGRLGTGHGEHPDAEHPPIEVARLAVGMATTLGVFLYQMRPRPKIITVPAGTPSLRPATNVFDDDIPF